MKTEWREVVGYEGLYEISNNGTVRSLNKKTLGGCFINNKRAFHKKLRSDKKGYVTVILSKEHKPKLHYVHRLVAIAFIPNKDNKPEVNHKDLNKKNNKISNLEWVTKKENAEHASLNGVYKKCYSEKPHWRTLKYRETQ